MDSANSTPVNPRPLLELTSLGDTLSTDFSTMPNLHICYKILLDSDGDGKDWYAYHYTTPKIPSHSLSEALPEKLDMQELLQLFKSQLTAKGLEVFEEVDFESHEYGCVTAHKDRAIRGCWDSNTGTIYINDHYVHEDYEDYTYIGKVIALRRALRTLTHEFFHATQAGLKSTIRRCHRSRKNFTDYYEKLPADVEACLHADPRWGTVTTTLKDFYETTEDKSSLPAIPQPLGALGTFSTSWYLEFRAWLSHHDTNLPVVLEDHYNLYIQDWRNFAGFLVEVEDFSFFTRQKEDTQAE